MRNLLIGSLLLSLAGSIWGACLFVAAITWALMSILLKLLSRYSVFTLTFYSVFIAFLVLSPYGIWWLINEANYEALAMPQIWGSVLYVGMIYHANGVVLKKKRLISSGEYWSCSIHHLTVSAKSQII
ncbi:hypothetical protein SAMN02910356_00404 [Selenomonas sp. GACV-9]|uniref:hypothetical protein n=1 Tax=Selenomonas sp. GACV-9 TaxID=3158782 RepID=UPI0008F33F09|nr:hypothetical protein SAMN02910356_00404 [Selenomonas ruminantium]